MKRKMLIAVAAVLLAAPAFVRAADEAPAPAAQVAEAAPAASAEGLTQEATENLVTVKVTYKNPEEWRPVFEVTLESRFVDLTNVKFGDVAILNDDLGGTFRTTEVTEAPDNDNHRKTAIVKFGEANASAADSLELTIQRVADVGIRSFKFTTKKGQAGSGF
jgi:hypothetical protein